MSREDTQRAKKRIEIAKYLLEDLEQVEEALEYFGAEPTITKKISLDEYLELNVYEQLDLSEFTLTLTLPRNEEHVCSDPPGFSITMLQGTKSALMIKDALEEEHERLSDLIKEVLDEYGC